jgi:hypothetical protein
MSIQQMANQDYERALYKAAWRKILTRLRGESNELLPFEQVREQLPFRGQRYIGMHEVPIDKIVGSMGRYRDFDRAFLPRQKRTRGRWINIDKAHYTDVILPPVELYKIGEIYFVIDGNHRVSVARERGQKEVDAHVIEIDTTVEITPDMDLNELALKAGYAHFIEQTHLPELCPTVEIELTLPGEYERLLEHISVHRWYLGELRREEVPYEQAVTSWCENVYTPLVNMLEQQGILNKFPDRTAADLYLWLIEYLWYRRRSLTEDFSLADAAKKFIQDYEEWPIGRLVSVLERAAWVDYLVLEQEKQAFFTRTNITEIRPSSNIDLTMPGLYERLFEHISVHRWYLGEQAGEDVPLESAVVSWYDNVYMPLVKLIRGLGILEEFPGRTESDLYLWIIERQAALQEVYGDVAVEQAAEQVVEDLSADSKKRGRKGDS